MPLRIRTNFIKDVEDFLDGVIELEDVKSKKTNLYPIVELCNKGRFDLAIELHNKKKFLCIHQDNAVNDFIDICVECTLDNNYFPNACNISRIIAYICDDIENNNICFSDEDKQIIKERVLEEKTSDFNERNLYNFITDYFTDMWDELSGEISWIEKYCIDYYEDSESEVEEDDKIEIE